MSNPNNDWRIRRPTTRSTAALHQSTLNDMSISPTPAGKRYPRATMKIFDGTKHEELTVLRFLLPEDADNLFRGPLNIEMKEFMPRHGLSDAV